MQDGEDVLETCHNVMDDLWKMEEWLYPQKRMVHLMDVTAHSITRFVQAKIHNVDLWASPYQELEETLQQVRIETQQNLLKTEVQGPKYSFKAY